MSSLFRRVEDTHSCRDRGSCDMIILSYCHNCRSLEKLVSEFYEGRKAESTFGAPRSLKGLVKETEGRQMQKGTRTGCVMGLMR